MEIDETLVDLVSVPSADANQLNVSFGDVLLIALAPFLPPSSNAEFPVELTLTRCIAQVVVAKDNSSDIADSGDGEGAQTDSLPRISLHPLVYEFLITSHTTLGHQLLAGEDVEEPASSLVVNQAVSPVDASVPIEVSQFIAPGITAQVYDDNIDPAQPHSLLPWRGRRISSITTLPPGSSVCLKIVYMDEDLRRHCDRKKGSSFQQTLTSTLVFFLEERILMVATTVLLPTPVGMALATVKAIQASSSQNATQSTNADDTAYRIRNCETCTVELVYDDETETAESKTGVHELEVVPTAGLSWPMECPGYEDLVQTVLQLAQIEGLAAPSGILLTGSPQVGKTHLASTAARRLSAQGFAVHWVSARELLLQATWANESDLLEMLRPPPTTAIATRREIGQLLVLDDLQIFASEDQGSLKEDAVTINTDPELLVVQNSVLQIIDELQSSRLTTGVTAAILGIAQSSVSLPAAFTQSGRLEKEVTMLPPTQRQREMILRALMPAVGVQDDDLTVQKWAEALSPATVSCVAGDLRRILASAWTAASARSWRHDDNEEEPVVFCPELLWEDLRHAAQTYVPIELETVDVSKPKSFTTDEGGVEVRPDDWATIHKLSWASFGGYPMVKKRLLRTVVGPWKRFLKEEEDTNKSSATMGLSPPPGVLFHGASGNGKSFAASCLASSLGLPMIKVTAADVLDKWLGGSEAILRSLFARARSAAPCILFFDEIDAVATNRAGGDDDGTEVMGRLLSTMLNEMDGISSDKRRHSVLVVACTNRLDDLDAALLRPGRLEEHVHLEHPNATDIKDMLQIHLSRVPLSSDLNLDYLAADLASNNATAADVEGLCREACMGLVHRTQGTKLELSPGDIEQAWLSSRLTRR